MARMWWMLGYAGARRAFIALVRSVPQPQLELERDMCVQKLMATILSVRCTAWSSSTAISGAHAQSAIWARCIAAIRLGVAAPTRPHASSVKSIKSREILVRKDERLEGVPDGRCLTAAWPGQN